MKQINQTRIKILVVGTNSTNFGNPFIDTLIGGIKRRSPLHYFCLDVNAFWNNDCHFDIIHIHWPEFLFYWKEPNEIDLFNLKNQIEKWKRTTRILYTRHNASVHYSKSEKNAMLYRIIESNADIVIHLGTFSKNHFKPKTSLQINSIIPHHTYDYLYSNNISKSKARQLLNISTQKIVILSFGAFRHQEEQTMLETAFQNLNFSDKFLLAPSWNKPFSTIKSSEHFFFWEWICK